MPEPLSDYYHEKLVRAFAAYQGQAHTVAHFEATFEAFDRAFFSDMPPIMKILMGTPGDRLLASLKVVIVG